MPAAFARVDGNTPTVREFLSGCTAGAEAEGSVVRSTKASKTEIKCAI